MRSTPIQHTERFFQAILAENPALPADALRRVWLRAAAAALFARRELPLPSHARLFRNDPSLRATAELIELERAAVESWLEQPELAQLATPHALGALFQALEGLEISGAARETQVIASRRRKRTGSFFTPPALAAELAGLALDQLQALGRLGAPDLCVCDPACGAGAFLIEAARGLCSRWPGAPSDAERAQLARWLVESVLVGVDVDAAAVDMAELSLAAWLAELGATLGATRLSCGDAVLGVGLVRPGLAQRANGVDWRGLLARDSARGVDLVIGNPPWVAFAGRAAQPLEPAVRSYFVRHYRAFSGYPTLQGVFVELACELAPRGVVALLVPSPLADLTGYRRVREVVLTRHEPCEPLLEFGQNAFAEVTQPCFALLAAPRANLARDAPEDRLFKLHERGRLGDTPRSVEPPAVLARLARSERLPPGIFGELGFQSTRFASERLFLRAEHASGEFSYPLLEGRDVREYFVGAPRLFLHADPQLLRQAGCRARPIEEYRRARFVIRQTARAPIAALHPLGLPFRNSLLAGFELPDYPAELVVGLLNSTLFRALHLSAQRDARQVVFPQVKVAHLRALPKPPRRDAALERALCETVQLAHADATARSPARRRELDQLVFELFDVTPEERAAVTYFLRERAAALAPPEIDPPS